MTRIKPPRHIVWSTDTVDLSDPFSNGGGTCGRFSSTLERRTSAVWTWMRWLLCWTILTFCLTFIVYGRCTWRRGVLKGRELLQPLLGEAMIRRCAYAQSWMAGAGQPGSDERGAR